MRSVWDIFINGYEYFVFQKKKSMKYTLNFVYWNFLFFFNQIFLKNMFNCAMRLDFFSMVFFSPFKHRERIQHRKLNDCH